MRKWVGLCLLLAVCLMAMPARMAFAYGTEDSVGIQNVSQPQINVWYGDDQKFVYDAQPFVNILGSVSDPDGIKSLSYSLNGGSARALSVGPDGRRLSLPGNFNIDISTSLLAHGRNTVVITAINNANVSSQRTVSFDWLNQRRDLPESINWSQVGNLQNVAQAVDGHWQISEAGVRSGIIAYDRILLIGDQHWQDYEVTVPITIHSIAPQYSGVGLILRWKGHSDNPVSGWQPKTGWLPLGSIGWFRHGRLEILDTEGEAGASMAASLKTGVTYMFKMQAETIPGHGVRYRKKVWIHGQSEPSNWHLSFTETANNALQSGSVGFLAHRADVTFGNVEVRPLAISNVAVSAGDTSATITWQTNAPSTGFVRYGATPAYERGSVGGGGFVTSHSVTLTDLTPGSLYYFSVVAVEADGTERMSPPATFTTTGSGGGGGGSGTFVSDDFTGQALNTSLWTFVNPLNNAALAISGNVLSISVPGGIDHDLWRQGRTAPRIMQGISDYDLDIEVKFNSPVTQQFQIQGIMIEDDSANYLRFDFHFDGVSQRLFAASFTNNEPVVQLSSRKGIAAPMYMRVKRSGSTWTMSWSSDGSTWHNGVTFSHQMTVRSAGVFVGNAGGGTAPAHTGLIDYVRNVGTSDPGDPGDPGDGGADGLVAKYKLNEGSGTVANDSGTFGYNGAIQGGAWVDTGDRSVLRLPGGSSRVVLGDISQLNNTGDFTLAGWFNQADVGSYNILLHKFGDDAHDISVATFLGRLYFEVGNGSNAYGYWTGFSNAVNSGEWFHIAAVFNGSAGNNAGRARLYVNGVERQMIFVRDIPSTTAALGGQALSISDSKAPFNGLVRDVTVWSKALNATEVAALHQETPSGPGTEPTPPPSGVLAGEWPFGEGSGSTTADQSSNGYTGTIHNAQWIAGVNNNALQFSGNGSYVSFGDVTPLNNAIAFTLTGWFKQANNSSYNILLHKSVDGANDISLATYLGRLYVEVGNGSNSYGYWEGYSQAIPSGNWFHAAMVFDGTGGNNSQRLRLYVNGVARTLVFVNTIPSSTANMSGRAFTASHPEQGFAGAIDELSAWTKALSGNEVAELYHGNQVQPPDPPPSTDHPEGLVASYPAQEGTGTQLPDHGPNGYHGTFNGAQWTTSSSGEPVVRTALNGYVNVGDVSQLNQAQAFTITGWFRQADNRAHNILVHKSRDGAHDISVATYLGRMYFEVGNGSNAYGYWPGYSGTIANNTWFHLAVVFDGTASGNSNRAKLYVNGVARPMTFVQTIPGATADLRNSPLTLSHPTQGFNGLMKAVTVWSRALTQQEVQQVQSGNLP